MHRVEEGLRVGRKSYPRIFIKSILYLMAINIETSIGVHKTTDTGNGKLSILFNPERNVNSLPYFIA